MPNSEGMRSMRSIFLNGILGENPTFRLVLGTCPTLAVTTAAINGVRERGRETVCPLGRVMTSGLNSRSNSGTR